MIKITVYRWAGAWGPFKIKIPCGECALTKDIIQNTLDNELKEIDIELEMREWLSEWWKPLLKGGLHAPIVVVNNKIVSQGEALNRGLLVQSVIEAYCEKSQIEGNHLFGKVNCGFCKKSKQALEDANINYVYHDVVEKPGALYEMIPRVKKIIGPKTPVTVPQIWLKGAYIGGFDNLMKKLSEN